MAMMVDALSGAGMIKKPESFVPARMQFSREGNARLST
jgi:hypothetical protein